MKFLFRSRPAHDSRELFRWHVRPGAFTRLCPGWEQVECDDDGPIHEGARRLLRVGPLRQKWLAIHDRFVEDASFRDYEARGPFPHWEHEHRFLPDGTLEDSIDCGLPLPQLSGGLLFRMLLRRMFIFRHLRTSFDLTRQRETRVTGTVAVTGASGLVGRQLCAFLGTAGWRVIRLVRRPSRGPDERCWSPPQPDLLEGVDVLVHLAGHNVADGNWNPKNRAQIRDSRVLTTERLATLIKAMDRPPRLFLVASGVNYYDCDQPGKLHGEDSPVGHGFLAEVCRDWEAAARIAEGPGTRVVSTRFGMVLARQGGALPKLLLPNAFGLGSVLGTGHQGVSWIGLEDAIGVLFRCIWDEGFSGPVNVVAPQPVSFRELVDTIARVTQRPRVFRIPAPVLRAALGPKAVLVVDGVYVQPQVLERARFPFLFPQLEGALRHELGHYTEHMLPDGWVGTRVV